MNFSVSPEIGEQDRVHIFDLLDSLEHDSDGSIWAVDVDRVRVQMPEGFDLLPGETLEEIVIPHPETLPLLTAEETLCRLWGTSSLDDIPAVRMPLAALDSGEAGQGIFAAEFCRDALESLRLLREFKPHLVMPVLRRIHEVLGRTFDERDIADGEAPGRVPHEVRDPRVDPIAQLQSATVGWRWPYYGSVDATPLFVEMALWYEEQYPGTLLTTEFDDGLSATLFDDVALAVEWIIKELDKSPDGLLESSPASNMCWQIWQDSFDANHHADGTLPTGKLAAIEVQSYAYESLNKMADFLERNPSVAMHLTASQREIMDPSMLRERAEKLRSSVHEKFRVDAPLYPGGPIVPFYALAVERTKEGPTRPLAIRNINMGLALPLFKGDEGIEGRAIIIRNLTDPEIGMMTPKGIRTASCFNIGFRPDSYQRGSIWPHVNYRVAGEIENIDGQIGTAREIRARVDRICEKLGYHPEKIPGTNDPEVKMTSTIIKVRTRDMHGNPIQNHAVQVGQKRQHWVAAGNVASLERERQISEGLRPGEAQEPKAQVREHKTLNRLAGHGKLYANLPQWSARLAKSEQLTESQQLAESEQRQTSPVVEVAKQQQELVLQ